LSRALVTLLAVLLASTEAWGYVRTQVPSDSGDGPFLYWKGHRIYFVLNEQGSASAGPSSLEAARASFMAWTEPECTDLDFEELPMTASSEVGYDKDGGNTNLVVWRERNCTDVVPGDAVCQEKGGCNNAFNCWEHAAETIAVTTTTFNNRTGELVDADIELNGASFTFSTVDMPVCPASGPTTRPPNCVATDIQNTLTHEVGHVLGLDHNLADEEATMYLSAQSGETEKRTLEQDDIDGVCAIYPVSDGDDVEGSGCGCASGSRAAALGLLPLLLWALRPRRRGAA
jgi:hypothetical protein